MRNKFLLFTDGSVNVQSGIGYGAYLLIPEQDFFANANKVGIKIKRFENTSSTKLELQILLLAFSEVKGKIDQLVVYSDCQNVIELLKRRKSLEKKQYITKKGIPLKHVKLYQAFYQWVDKFNCEFIKIKGHQASHKKNELELTFAKVDRASRKALRGEFNK